MLYIAVRKALLQMVFIGFVVMSFLCYFFFFKEKVFTFQKRVVCLNLFFLAAFLKDGNKDGLIALKKNISLSVGHIAK